MKKLNFIEKFIFIINSILAFALLLSYALPYLPPEHFSFLSVLVLGVPFLIFTNVLFVVFWVLKIKKQFILSLVILGLGYPYLFSFYNLKSSNNLPVQGEPISIMSFNVKGFNYKGVDTKERLENTINFVNSNDLDIVCFQEFALGKKARMKGFKKVVVDKSSDGNNKSDLAVFSKYKVLKHGSLDFPNSANNGMFVDLLVKNDTLRVFNVHFQSLSINYDIEILKDSDKENLAKHIGSIFRRQQQQVDVLERFKSESPYKHIVVGDFNNTAFSYVYRKAKGDLVDAFSAAGSGFGKTFNLKFFPLRIDYILLDDSFKISNFETLKVQFSDHYPIKSEFYFN